MSVPTNGNIVMKPREWALLIVLSILWGGSFFFVEVASVDLPPLTLVLGRVGIAAAALLLMVRCLGHHMPRDRRAWGAFAIMGALNNLIPFCLIVWGQTHIASGLAAILNATTPLFTVVLAHFLTHDEKMTPMRLIGVLIGLAGVTVMFGAQFLAGPGLGSVAQIAVLGAAVSYACAGLFGRRFRDTPPHVTAAGQLTATTVLMLPMALIIDRPWTLALPSLTIWAAIIALALLCTATAYVLYFRIWRRRGRRTCFW